MIRFLASLLPDDFWLWMATFAHEECDRRCGHFYSEKVREYFEGKKEAERQDLIALLDKSNLTANEFFRRLEIEDGKPTLIERDYEG